jgi:hypothetical protein
MSMTLNGTTIRQPNEMVEDNSTQVTENRTLNGAVNRDYFGSRKRKWTLTYSNITKDEYDTINTIYLAHLASGTAVPFISTETNYTVSSTNVHVDLLTRGFRVKGVNYLSDFELILTEA